MDFYPELDLVTLNTKKPIWDHFFKVAPLVVVGTKGKEEHDLAPKHLVMPLGWENYFCFVCTPSHQTYQNILLKEYFSVSFVNPDQVVLTSLTASPKCEQHMEKKPIIDHIPTFKASKIDALFLQDGYLYLECELVRIIDGFGRNSLIIGKVTEAHVAKKSYLSSEKDQAKMLKENPLMVYLDPGRFAKIENTIAFPFPKEFRK